MRRILPAGEIFNHQSGEEIVFRMDSSGTIAQEESPMTAPFDLSSQQIVEASSNINSVDTRSAPSIVMMDRRVRLSKYCSIVPISTELAKKTSVSNKDKSFDNIDMLDKALRASNLPSLVDRSRKPPDVTTPNSSGYSAESIITTIKADGSRTFTVIAEDDYHKYYADSILAFTFMLSMINKDMHHMLSEAIKDEDPTRVWKEPPRGISEEKAECSPAWAGHRKRFFTTTGFDIGVRSGSEDGYARIAEIWNIAKHNELIGAITCQEHIRHGIIYEGKLLQYGHQNLWRMGYDTDGQEPRSDGC